MKPRTSLRGLLLLTACLAALCWWRNRPRQIANRFVASIEAGDYEAADAMFVRGRSLQDETVGHATFSASQYKPSLADWMRGERFIDLNWEYPGTKFGGELTVTAWGVEDINVWPEERP